MKDRGYEEALAAWYALRNDRRIRPSLDGMRKALERLGNPEKRFRSVHITGTNGKGSTAAFLASIYGQVYRTGLYTSPHLVDFSERIRIGGKPITHEGIMEGMQVLAPLV